MTFQADKVEAFQTLFFQNCMAITASAGCQKVNLLRAEAVGTTFFTISTWESIEHLEAYRNSHLFKEVWGKTKAMFADKPEAWSLEEVQA
jgi:quinol monooxygenase YgiN